MNPSRGRDDANNCFVCGPDNPIGLRIRFRLEGELCVGEFTPGNNHMGYNDVVHGGVIYSAMDDVMANWLFLKGVRAYTARCSIRYRHPVRPGSTLCLEGRLVKRKGKLAVLQGKAICKETAQVCAETEASFLVDEST